MPDWNDLLNETRAAGGVQDVLRRKYLRKLYRLTKRNAIIYYSGWLQKRHLLNEKQVTLGISDEDKNGFMTVIHKMDRSKGLDLILHTPGGDMAATESLVDYLRATFGKDIRAIIPQLAMSGGTLMALACKEIIMGKESSIGPVDPQFGRMAANGLLQEFKRIRAEIRRKPADALVWQPILAQIEPGFITECENAVKWSRQMAKGFLVSNMLNGRRDKSKIADRIVRQLTDKQTTITHGRHIGYDEARKILGDRVKKLEDDQALQEAVLTVHHMSMITLGQTSCYKLIENHNGRALIQQAATQVVQMNQLK